MNDWFISDLHLSEDEPSLIVLFSKWVDLGDMAQGDQLWVLGDLFDIWLGDAHIHSDAYVQKVLSIFLGLSRRGVKVNMLVGNRDFMLGKKFCKLAKVNLIKEPFVVNLSGYVFVMLHGDVLCTNDFMFRRPKIVTFVRFILRRVVYPLSSFKFRLALKERILLHRSQKRIVRNNTLSVEDRKFFYNETEEGIMKCLSKLGRRRIDFMIHGHTHNPSVHPLPGNFSGQRWVIPDWRVSPEGRVGGGALRFDGEKLGFIWIGDRVC